VWLQQALRQIDEGEMQVAFGCVVEHFLRAFGYLAGGFAEWCPQNDIQLRWNDREEVVVGLQVVE